MTDYLLRRHVLRVCTPTLNNDVIFQCGACPFEEIILGVAPELAGNFQHKRQLIKAAHEEKRKFRDNN
jgi:hypothetical protein